MTTDELLTCITADLLTIKKITKLAGHKGDLTFDVIKKIAKEGLNDIEEYKEGH